MKKLKKIGYVVFLILVIFTTGLLVVSAVPIPGNYKILVVRSGSMEPSIKTGSNVFSMPADDYVVSDVITFRSTSFKDKKGNALPVTHRITEVLNNSGDLSYMTKGDNNDTQDINSTPRGAVVGKVLFTMPYLGYVIEGLRSKYGFLALIMIPALIIIKDQGQNISREIKQIKMNKEKTTS